MNNPEIRAIVDRYWEATTDHELEKVHEFYHDDVVVEFPQSSERIRGKQNIYELRSHYPSKSSYKILRVRGDGKDLHEIQNRPPLSVQYSQSKSKRDQEDYAI